MLTTLLPVTFLLLLQSMNIETQKSALCYMAYRPPPELLEFAQILAEDAIKYDVEIFIMVDDENFNISAANVSSNVHLLNISRQTCLQHNYHKAINSGGTWRYLTSWDKSLLYFSVFNQNHSFVWFLEEDVFIPDVQVLRSLHQLYANTTDLIVPRQELNLIASDGLWRWVMASGKFLPPWACSMVNVVAFSRRMLTAMDRFVQWLGEVPFHEFFFNTLAVQLNFTIVTPTELSTIEYAKVFYYKDVRRQPSNMWHPIKDFPQGLIWRKNLINESSQNNRSFQLTDLHVLYDRNLNKTVIEQHFEELFVRFETQKRHFPSLMRPKWRQQFLDFAEECRKRNLSQEIISFAIQLADHAYKLPEPPVQELLKVKTALHRQLEREINETKQAIYQFTSNGSAVAELRKQATELIKKLTWEMRLHYFEEERLKNLTTTSSTTSTMTATLFSTTTSITTTINTSTSSASSTSSVTHVTRAIENNRFDTMQVSNSQKISDRIKISTKIISILSVLFILFMVSKWKNLQRRYSFKVFAVSLMAVIAYFAVIT